jgi:hypothetical protein
MKANFICSGIHLNQWRECPHPVAKYAAAFFQEVTLRLELGELSTKTVDLYSSGGGRLSSEC